MRDRLPIVLVLFAISLMTLGGSTNAGRIGTEQDLIDVPEPSGEVWLPFEAASGETRQPSISPERFRLFAVDSALFAAALADAPSQAAPLAPGAIVQLPLPDGRMAQFRVFDAPVMAPSLAARLQQIRTYAGQGLDDPSASVRLSWTSRGLHAQIVSTSDTVYIHPYWPGDSTVHASYYGRDYGLPEMELSCDTPTETELSSPDDGDSIRATTSPSWGGSVREYVVALVADAEFFQKNSTEAFCPDGTTSCDLDSDCAGTGGGSCLPSLASRLAEAHQVRVDLVNDVNGFLETEVGIRYVLVDDGVDHVTILWDPDAQNYPFLATTACAARLEAQDALEALSGVLPLSSYGLGHLVSGRWLGGCASSNVTCEDTNKGKGTSGRAVRVAGDPWWVYLVRHESSHQFDAGHTYTGRDNSCTSGQMDGPASVEPGAGSTFMAYDGFCRCDNIREHNPAAPVVDKHYHSVNLGLMRTEGDNKTCWSPASTGNNPPTVDAGPDLVIPKGTPFYLDVAGSGDDDPEDVLAYVWEQMDNITDSDDRRFLSDPDDGQIPLFRSVPPETGSMRFFPSLPNLLAGYEPSSGEKLPALARTMTMRVTVRDNRAGGGGVAWDERLVTVHGSSGPFSVSAPSFFDQWQPGTQTVTWTVAGTNQAPLDVDFVRITLSTDAGLSFDHVLAASAPNDGSAEVTIPAVAAARARIMVEAIGGVFFNVSPSFIIGDCLVDSECDDDRFCNGTETCDPGGSCQPGSAACTSGLCLERYDTCAANESYVISRNPDFSTDDRTFYRNQNVYSLVWTDDVDYLDPKEHWYEYEGSITTNRPLCNRLDHTYNAVTSPGNFGDLPLGDWDWKARVKDNSNNRYEPSDAIQIVPCTEDANCVDAQYCNGPEYCDEASGNCRDANDPCDAEYCDEENNTCVDCLASAECLDALFCNGEESCVDGTCVPGDPPCVGGFCDETDGCFDCYIDDDCTDGLFCTGDETCVDGTCVPGEPPCPPEDCDETNGCAECSTDGDCHDGEFCNGEEVCVDETCVDGVAPCEPNEACNEVDDYCASYCPTSGDCGGDNCRRVFPFECTQSNTGDGACWEGDDDFFACPDGRTLWLKNCACEAIIPGALCLREDRSWFCGCNSAADCDDGEFCNGEEFCYQGHCKNGQPPCFGPYCDEDDDYCRECIMDEDCDDGQFCNGPETCDIENETCVGGTDPCHGLPCDEEADVCHECVVDGDCPDDGLFCNGTEVCDAGFCSHAGTPCARNEGCRESDDYCAPLCPSSRSCSASGCQTLWPDVCARYDTEEAICWQGGEQFFECPSNQTIRVRNCLCDSGDPGPVCPREDQTWFCE